LETLACQQVRDIRPSLVRLLGVAGALCRIRTLTVPAQASWLTGRSSESQLRWSGRPVVLRSVELIDRMTGRGMSLFSVFASDRNGYTYVPHKQPAEKWSPAVLWLGS